MAKVEKKRADKAAATAVRDGAAKLGVCPFRAEEVVRGIIFESDFNSCIFQYYSHLCAIIVLLLGTYFSCGMCSGCPVEYWKK
ncbi:hypothetical protein NC653_040187 [Populus alba x Populus x berolinensis]|uniref:Uncharacterized protein n=1 Tax=Populus alba x Populus x berolinensis TaxID=444605 RepID=A0AAD6PSA8_9ROSI|nr:hypothetical protein NC653_040187 [Populus alba x Populus x berolinensis]